MVSAEALKTENQDGAVEGQIDGWGFEGGELDYSEEQWREERGQKVKEVRRLPI